MNNKNLQVLTIVLTISLIEGCASGQRNHAGDDRNIEPGKTRQMISCEADTLQKYALFIPSAYTPDKTWPLLSS